MKIQEYNDNYFKDIEALAKTDLQKSSVESFKTRGLPHTKMEDWIYTKLTDILPKSLKRASGKNLSDFNSLNKNKIVLLNGELVKDHTDLPSGISVEKYQNDAITKDHLYHDKNDIFANLNSSLTNEAILITISKNIVVKEAISIINFTDASEEFSTPRINIVAENFSEVDFVEIFQGIEDQAYNVASVTNFNVKTGAKITHTKVQIDSREAFHAGSVYANIDKDASFQSFTFTTGAKKSRNHIETYLNASGAYASVDGLYAISEGQHTDNFSLISHHKEHTDSSQLFKGVLDGNARGVFTGKVLVCRNAQKVNSEQLNKNLLLTKKAHADTRPQLEVYADDVKCAHGATVGQLNEEEAFYLQSRGLSKERAQKLLIHAFCSETILKVKNIEIQKFLSDTLFSSFEEETFKHIDEQISK